MGTGVSHNRVSESGSAGFTLVEVLVVAFFLTLAMTLFTNFVGTSITGIEMSDELIDLAYLGSQLMEEWSGAVLVELQNPGGPGRVLAYDGIQSANNGTWPDEESFGQDFSMQVGNELGRWRQLVKAFEPSAEFNLAVEQRAGSHLDRYHLTVQLTWTSGGRQRDMSVRTAVTSGGV